MAEQFLEDIYKRSLLVTKMRRAVDNLYINVRWKGLELLEDILPDMFNLCKEAADAGFPKARTLFESIMKATTFGDASQLVYAFEREIIPITLEYLQTYGKIEMEADEDYCFESAENGFLTIKAKKQEIYLHSLIDPMYEAWKNMEFYYDPMKTTYRIYGCGLGYHIYALYSLSLRSVNIILYEPDERLVEYARLYGVLDWIPKDHITIITENAHERYMKEKKCEGFEDFWMLPNSSEVVEDKEKQIELGELGMHIILSHSYARREKVNFSNNIQKNPVDISEIDLSLFKKEVVLVGAGPSLTECYDFLRENKGKRTIIAVGTVLKKLLKENIVPDMFFELDSYYLIHPQIEGVEDCGVPMIYSSTTDWGTVADYKGPKYIVHSSPVMEVVNYVKETGNIMWSNGGSVLTLAMSVANGMGAEKVYLVGADLGYPGGKVHADGTATRTSIEAIRDSFMVTSVGGGTVESDYPLTKYRIWFENYIAANRHLTVYNLSRGGARIKGTIEVDHEGGRIVERK